MDKVSRITTQLMSHIENKNFYQVGTIETGGFFGEQALLNNKPRAATIQCLTPCFFAIMDKHDYEKSFGKIQRLQQQRMISFYKSIPFF